MRRCARRPSGARRLRALAAREAGDTLIEVIVGAMLVGLIISAVFTGLDVAGRASASERQHARADLLAQQDEDRLRGLQVSDLTGTSGNQTRTVTVDGVTYSITSTSVFYSDSTGTSSCTATGTPSASYVKATSSVTWQGMGARSPVVEESLLTPPQGGALLVQVFDQNGNGVSGMNVNLSGTGIATATTNSNGCAILAGLAPGPYNTTVSQAGYVDKNGNSTPPAQDQLSTVVAQVTEKKPFYFAQGGAISASFTTTWGGSSHPSSADTLVAFNNKMTLVPSIRCFPSPAPNAICPPTPPNTTYYHPLVTPSTMFPFTTPYSVYAGSCTADDPLTNGQSADPSVIVPAAGTGTVALALPAMLVRVYSGSTTGSPLVTTAPNVRITDTGCSPNVVHSPATQVPTLTNSGALVDPGQPYGNFTVCADNGTLKSTATVVNNDPVNGKIVNVFLAAGTSGTCP